MNDGVPARGSLRSRSAVAVSTTMLRPITGAIPPDRAWGIWASRRLIARLMGTFGPSLAGTRVEQVNTVLPDGRRVVGEWVFGPQLPATHRSSNGAVYYVHGSGYTMCSPRTHRRLTSWLSSLTGLPVFCVDYRLAPRYRLPTAADDVRAGWEWIPRACGLPPERIVIAGDSAAGINPTHHRLALNVAGGPVLPPALIQAGAAEMLEADARQLAADIRVAGGSCERQVWPDQMHVFQALPRMAPEAAKAMAYVTQFIANSLRDNAAAEAG